jgi:putative endonuclease
VEDRGNHRQTLGERGENLACRYLEGIGHTILERNWRSGHLEIDIISADPQGIHFVEVKTRQKNVQAPPQENVGKTKQARLVKAALGYLNSETHLPRKDMECFFDIIAITFQGENAQVEWIPQAFIPLYI